MLIAFTQFIVLSAFTPLEHSKTKLKFFFSIKLLFPFAILPFFQQKNYVPELDKQAMSRIKHAHQ
jgi:hypothetical protein